MKSEIREAKYLKSVRVRLTNKRGLHARAAAKFSAIVNQHDVEVEVTSCNDICEETVEADSTMELLLLGSACGEEISIQARGIDAEIVVTKLEDLVKNRFGEDE